MSQQWPGNARERGSLEPPARAAAPATRPRINGLKMHVQARRCFLPIWRLDQGVAHVGDGEVGLQVLVVLARLVVALQHV